MKLLINKEKFLDWYFDYEIQKEFFNRHGILSALKKDGVFSINANELLDDIGYIPEQIVEEGQELHFDDLGEIDTFQYDEITFS